MKFALLFLHISSVATTIVYIITTFVLALRRQGDLRLNKIFAIITTSATFLSGGVLTLFSSSPVGVACLQASSILIGVVASYLVLDKRLSIAEKA